MRQIRGWGKGVSKTAQKIPTSFMDGPLPYSTTAYKEGCAIYVHYNLFMLFIGHHKASDFTGQVAIVSHQAIAIAHRSAGGAPLRWRCRFVARAPATYHKKKTFSFLKSNLFVFLEKRSSIRCRIDL